MAMFDLALAALLASLVGLALYRTTVPRRVFYTRHQWLYVISSAAGQGRDIKRVGTPPR